MLAIYLCRVEALKALLTWLKKNEGAHKHRDHDVSRAAQVGAFRRDRSRHAFGLCGSQEGVTTFREGVQDGFRQQ